MRNTKLYIIAALVVLVVVIVLATILTNQFRNNQDQTQGPENQEKVETTTAKILSRTERLREASRITKQSNTSLLSDDQVKRLDALKSKIKAGENGMLTTDDFDIGYSDVTNKFYVQKKTDKADTQFEAFLKENNALDILQTDLSLFVKTDQPLTNYIKEQENYLLEALNEEPQPNEANQGNNQVNKNNNGPTPNPYEEKVQKDLNLAKQYLKAFSLFKFSTPVSEEEINQQTNSSTIQSLSIENQNELTEFNKQLPKITNDFEFGYSNITNEYYLYKKTSNADQAFLDFLEDYDKQNK